MTEEMERQLRNKVQALSEAKKEQASPVARVSRITIGRLYNLGNYEQCLDELQRELSESVPQAALLRQKLDALEARMDALKNCIGSVGRLVATYEKLEAAPSSVIIPPTEAQSESEEQPPMTVPPPAVEQPPRGACHLCGKSCSPTSRRCRDCYTSKRNGGSPRVPKTCEDCGEPCSPTAVRCRACGLKRQEAKRKAETGSLTVEDAIEETVAARNSDPEPARNSDPEPERFRMDDHKPANPVRPVAPEKGKASCGRCVIRAGENGLKFVAKQPDCPEHGHLGRETDGPRLASSSLENR